MFYTLTKKSSTLAQKIAMFWLNCRRAMVSKLYRWLRLPPQDVYHMVLHVRDAERYSIILEVLDDVVFENQNAEWIQSRSTLLEEKTVFKICFLEDLLSNTNVLCLVLQTGKKDFGAISRAVSNCIKMLE